MLTESIVLYDEPKAKQEHPFVTRFTGYVDYYSNYGNKMFSVFEISNAVTKLMALGYHVGKYFKFSETSPTYLIKKYETRPVFVDPVRGYPGVLIAQRVGQMVEVAFSYESLDGAFICSDDNNDSILMEIPQ